MKWYEVLGDFGTRQLGGIVAFGATSISFFTNRLGGWDVALQFLVFMMIFDYLSGFWVAKKKKQINSDAMYWGGIRKGSVILVLVVAVYADQLLYNGEPVFRNLTVYYYLAREGFSVFENLALLGVPLPQQLVDMFAQLKSNTAKSPVDKMADKFAKPGEEVEPISQQLDIAEEVAEQKKLAE